MGSAGTMVKKVKIKGPIPDKASGVFPFFTSEKDGFYF